MHFNFLAKICFNSTIKVHFNYVDVKFIHVVEHSSKRRIFYTNLDKNHKLAVLYYKIDDKVMDLRTLTVPDPHKGKGIARLLTETAFTYAILNEYNLYLTCTYIQKYYLANKNNVLRQYIVGPNEVLEDERLMDESSFDGLIDPEDDIFDNNNK